MAKKGLVFINIGTPEDLSVEAVKKYLKLFLMDKYVIDLPFPIRWVLVNMIIAPFRAKKSYEAYKEIWSDKGSPLEVYTKELVEDATKSLNDSWHVEYAMSYSNPFISDVLDTLNKKGVEEIYILPMYPQYAESTSRSTIEAALEWGEKHSSVKIKTLEYFFDHISFVKSSKDKISQQIQTLDDDTHYLFSYHGLPFRHVKKLHPKHCKNDKSCCSTLDEKNEFCYRAQCHHTTEILAKELGLKDYSYSFQSRLGKDQWLLPYTVNHVAELAKSNKKKIAVLPYAFTIDCLETEEEIEAEVQEAFKEAGGEHFHRVECLNRDFSKVLDDKFFESFS